jgi:uncharacterized protein (DUF1499 family)
MKITKFKVLMFIIAGLVLFQVYKNFSIPNTVGIQSGEFKALKESPNGVSSQTSIVEKKVSPFIMNTSVSDAKEDIKKQILSYDNTRLIKESDNYLHFVFTTKGFHFKDDVEFYFDSENNIIDFKSQSRIGYSDMGVNKERYEMIKKDFNQ